MDARRGDRGAEQRRLQRPREDHRAAAGADEARGLRVGKHHHRAARRERLGQRGHHDRSGRERTVAEHGAASVPPRPAQAVGVVDVQAKLLVPRDQLAQRRVRRRVAVHAVDAVGEIPDAAVTGRELAHQLVQPVDPVVAHEAAGRSRGLERRQHGLHAVVNELVADDGVFASDQDRQRREVRQRGRLRHDQGRPEHRAQQALQLRVRRAGDVGARGRELDAVARHRVAGRILEAQVGLEAHVRARSEVDLPAPAQRQVSGRRADRPPRSDG